MELRNIAIIAHVDHGKTTLVDALLKQSDSFHLKADDAKELIMDSNELERERGITIFSKNASIRHGGVKINIVDTPGHADFGGEVERIMRMVDGVLLLVDAKEGPMPQTKFVLRKAIEAGHKIIVVINKIDKPAARPVWVLNATYDLFFELGASEAQVEFPVIYASAVMGKAGRTPDLVAMKNVEPIFETIVSYIPAPETRPGDPLQMLTVNLAYDNYKGKLAVGRLYAGTLKKGMAVAHINRAGETARAAVSAVMLFEGLNRVDVEEAHAGEIVAVAGIPEISIGETIADAENPVVLPVIHIDEPTIKMTFGVNTSPFRGREGEYTTSRNLKERLERELETDVALKVTPTASADRWVVAGRGELHLAILVEKMRRDGFEFEVSKPQVIFKEIDGKKMEPMELVSVEVPNEFAGVVIVMMGKRSGTMKEMKIDGGTTLMDFAIPTRGLIGSRGEFLTNTKGLGIMNSIFLGYEGYKGEIRPESRGSIVATETGTSNSFGLLIAQGRGKLFIGPGVPVYEGMVVGQNAKSVDMPVNICKAKELTNFRSKNEGTVSTLDVPLSLSLEDSLAYISDNEMVEITPKSIRIRKIYLSDNERKKARKEEKALVKDSD
ncbi:GTP-binding protein TypA [Candidatus Jorgensenbacteria bacterium GWA1_49_17]|uniref:Large ribosomal subunit assembly factor BipA n=2 Tax=Candidatus Joergenseniibacteriota TaxID=1752739 RepID=A0A1F6BQV3_9BACT|nr:MAG: GTP-binding protein TypA [Candidatus Jorgensenbacteria bacterium GWC1_48_12]OGG40026.1 MAG: GTP-binding protein TypA [Candidatus Jorgensenbacteria bacterium GWA1_49_17]